MTGRGTVLGGRYTLTERIGGGGMGAVWRADDEVLARQVAVKILHPALFEDGTFATRFRREARLLAALNHPGIVDVHDYGESGEGTDDRIAYIVMELVDGQPLHEALAESGPMPAERALGLLAEALDALHAAHRRDIVHRDIKPSNLMLGADGRVTVTDFGIARALASTKITASHSVLGTALYMAPEQAEGAATTPACDLYAIGVVCYELLTGETPFTGESVLEVALKHIREPAPELPAEFPAAVRAFVAAALQKRPADRFPDAAAMAAAARAAIGDAPSPAPAAPVPVPPVPVADEAEKAGPEKAGPGKADAGKADAGKAEPTAAERPPRRTWRGLLVPIVIPVVVTAGATTVLLVDRVPFRSEANAPGPQQSVTAPAAAGTGTPPPATAPAVGAPTTATGAAAPSEAAPATGAGNQPVNTVPDAGAGAAGGQGTTPRGGATTPAPGQPAPAPAPGTKAATTPAPATPAQTPTTPPGCGGSSWGAIVNVGDGLRLGLAKDSPAPGSAVIMGGTTAYGWVHSVPSSWHHFNPCNLSGPDLVQEPDGKVSLSGGFSVLTNWTVTPASTPGAYYLKDYMGQNCLTDNGAGRQLTMVTCTPGNNAQQWRIP
ncbi:serine/threonine protein kinase [Kitasatospora sp. NBC_00374]|uniref:serine/threonine-protein kinase n=1 Tax=Kitasatospora sp. NBC_00374 TaxID=2975964 RepID=UPI0030E1AE0C